MKRGWQTAADVTLPPFVGYETDEWIFREYSLFLLINRHVADCIDDDTVSRALHKLRERMPLPFEN